MFDQWFVYCGVCYRRSSAEDPLLLTSCAHILCSQHWNSSFNSCSICQAVDISVIELAEGRRMPPDIMAFFQPFNQLLETVYNVSQFQTIGLVNQCKHFQEYVIKLQATCSKQRQILYQTKAEIDSIPKLRQKIKFLESELENERMLKSNRGTKRNITNNGTNNNNKMNFLTSSSKDSFRHHSLKRSESHGFLRGSNNMSRNPPPTVDLTIDDDNNADEIFLKKLKKNANSLNTSSFPKTPDIVAESTQISESFTKDSMNGSSDPMGSLLQRRSSKEAESSITNTTDTKQKVKLPAALEKLRIIKRSNTTTVIPSRTPTDDIKKGIINHMKSSGHFNRRELSRGRSSFSSQRRNASSQQVLSKFSRK
ncbi:hypothetical protein TPHA_0B00750 [Tetrapisispora phaffii CBS 4417]|uniref:RING-type domain-containing protein n=1 Tax=Tetrapisispora phaffii (strain ATCC 24235 / CBS 4417 / NBRC 1672 / NRRL Y-8282 / UCD 70-5) TaxID=1071381 RepID=G8BQF0_TETPH|nr:hypothetical protein TPHA_0B00750 [Tetrapisispora phaffii CBS 4417]CCE61747.1 hypothetical protein TPHA_0B00750 [Tetrapisispora phaffii CBS 4417]